MTDASCFLFILMKRDGMQGRATGVAFLCTSNAEVHFSIVDVLHEIASLYVYKS